MTHSLITRTVAKVVPLNSLSLKLRKALKSGVLTKCSWIKKHGKTISILPQALTSPCPIRSRGCSSSTEAHPRKITAVRAPCLSTKGTIVLNGIFNRSRLAALKKTLTTTTKIMKNWFENISKKRTGWTRTNNPQTVYTLSVRQQEIWLTTVVRHLRLT